MGLPFPRGDGLIERFLVFVPDRPDHRREESVEVVKETGILAEGSLGRLARFEKEDPVRVGVFEREEDALDLAEGIGDQFDPVLSQTVEAARSRQTEAVDPQREPVFEDAPDLLQDFGISVVDRRFVLVVLVPVVLPGFLILGPVRDLRCLLVGGGGELQTVRPEKAFPEIAGTPVPGFKKPGVAVAGGIDRKARLSEGAGRNGPVAPSLHRLAP